MARRGWRKESARHSLAARGVKSASPQSHSTRRFKERKLKKPVMMFMSWDTLGVNDGYFDYTMKLKHNQVDEPNEWQKEIDEIGEMKLDEIIEKYHPKVTPARRPLRYSSGVTEEED